MDLLMRRYHVTALATTTFFRSFQVVPQIEFNFIEFNCWHPSDILPSNIRRMRMSCAEIGLTPTSIYGSEGNHPFCGRKGNCDLLGESCQQQSLDYCRLLESF